MFFWNLTSLCVLLFLVKVKSSDTGAVKNNYFKLCSRSSPDFGKCIQKSIMEAKPKLINGIPEIGFPRIEPWAFPPLYFKEHNRHFKISVRFTDMYYGGFSNSTVSEVKVSGDIDSEMTINLTVTAPVFRSWGSWAGTGRAFQFSVNGHGELDANFTQMDLKLTVKGRAEIDSRDGKKHFAVKSVYLDPVIRKVRAYLSNLFPDENLTKQANKFINRNIAFIFRLAKQYPQKYIGGELEKIVKTVFDAWPIDELMLE